MSSTYFAYWTPSRAAMVLAEVIVRAPDWTSFQPARRQRPMLSMYRPRQARRPAVEDRGVSTLKGNQRRHEPKCCPVAGTCRRVVKVTVVSGSGLCGLQAVRTH